MKRAGEQQHEATVMRIHLALSLVAVAACGSSDAAQEPSTGADGGAAGSEPGMLDDQGIEKAAMSYARDFTRVNKQAYPTRQHLGNMPVDVFANAAAERTYRAIDYPATASGAPRFPAGSMLVKAMLDGGAPVVLTVMYKKAPGYDPPHGDWWYGRLNVDGTPTNVAYVGKVDFCDSCHSGAAATDFAWGIVPSNK